MKLKNIAVATTLAVAAAGALAADQSITLTQTGAGSFAAMFSQSQAPSPIFVDTFTFSLPGMSTAGLGSGALTFATLSGPITLTLATLDGGNGMSVQSPPDPDSIAFPSSIAFAGFTAPLTLTVLGSAFDSGSYSGSISFNTAVAAIPEPETYALMLAGLAGIGFAARRRKGKVKAPSTGTA